MSVSTDLLQPVYSMVLRALRLLDTCNRALATYRCELASFLALREEATRLEKKSVTDSISNKKVHRITGLRLDKYQRKLIYVMEENTYVELSSVEHSFSNTKKARLTFLMVDFGNQEKVTFLNA